MPLPPRPLGNHDVDQLERWLAGLSDQELAEHVAADPGAWREALGRLVATAREGLKALHREPAGRDLWPPDLNTSLLSPDGIPIGTSNPAQVAPTVPLSQVTGDIWGPPSAEWIAAMVKLEDEHGSLDVSGIPPEVAARRRNDRT